MFEPGMGTVEAVDEERGIEVKMIAADGEGYQEYRMTGPGLAVRFGTERNLRSTPPSWRIRVVAREEVAMPDDELLPLIEDVVKYMSSRLLKTDSSNFTVSF